MFTRRLLQQITKKAKVLIVFSILFCIFTAPSFAAREARIYEKEIPLNIKLDANGSLPNSGNWKHDLNAGAQSAVSKATRGGIIVGALDVDYPSCEYPKANCEHDELFVNGRSLGYLEGSNDATEATEKSIPAGTLTSSGSAVNVQVKVHDTSTGQYRSNWTVTIKSSKLFFYANEDFILSATPGPLSSSPAGTARYQVSTDFIGIWDNPVDLSVSGLPAGATANLSANSIDRDGGNATLTVTLKNVAVGNYPLTITGSGIADYDDKSGSNRVTRTEKVNLVVEEEPGDFTLDALPGIRSIDQGASATYTVNVGFEGSWSDPVGLSVTDLPQGAAAVFIPANLSQSGNSTLQISTKSHTPEGTHTLTIKGNGGGVTKTAAVNLVIGKVADYTLAASPATRSIDQGASTTYTVDVGFEGSWSDPVGLSVSGLPKGATASFDSTTLNKSGRSTLTVTTDTFTPENAYSLLITGTGGGVTKTASVNLVIGKVADFMVSATPDKLTIMRGENTAYDVTVTFGGSWATSVVLSVQGLPRDAYAEFTPAAFSGTGESMLIVTTKNTTPPGSYPLTIAGKSGGVDHTAAVTLVVTEEPVEGGDFSLSFKEGIEAEIGGAYEAEIYAQFNGSCEGPVGISLDETSPRRLPNGLLVELSGKTMDINDPYEILIIGVDTMVPAGEYRVNVVGKGCDMEDVATLVILVEAPRLSIVKRQSHSSVVPGQVQVYTLSVTNEGDFPVTRVMVKDELESNLDFVKHTASGQHSTIERSHSFSLTEELVPGDTTSFQIHAKVDDSLKAGVSISNTAKVITAESPEPESSNTVTAITSYAPVEADALYVDKSLAYGRPKIGAILVYEIRVENRDQHGRVFDIRIDDRLPNGFKYVEGTSLLNGKNIADPAGNGRIVWENLGDLSAGDSFTLKYRVVIGLNAKSGRNENCADAEGIDGGGNEVSGSDCALVMLGPGDVKELGEIKAMVFVDTNGNGVKDAADTPFEGAEVILVPPGLKQTTDENGETLFAELKPKEYVVALNPRKLNTAYQHEKNGSKLIQLLEGEHAEITYLVSDNGGIQVFVNSKRIMKTKK